MSTTAITPSPEHLKRLAVSESGFIFDPVSGLSFTLSLTALFLLEQMRQGQNQEQLLTAIQHHYEVEPHEAERDLHGFIKALNTLLQ